MARWSLESSSKPLDYVSDNDVVRKESGKIVYADEQPLSNEELKRREDWKHILSEWGYLEYYEDITKLSNEEFEKRIASFVKKFEETKPEREAKAKAEQEAKAKAEQEAKEKAEQEAKVKKENTVEAKTEEPTKTEPADTVNVEQEVEIPKILYKK